MTISGKKLVFFGNERLATGVGTTVPTLSALIGAGYDVAAVVSNFTRGQSRNNRQLEIQGVAREHNIHLLTPAKPAEITEQLAAYGAEIGVLVAYGKIVPRRIIDIFPKGIVNIHPSLLPLHRGPTPIESVLINGETKTGVSLMSLGSSMDSGPVYAQSELALAGNETKQQLADELLDIGKSMLIELLPDILSGSVVALPQDDQRATYDSLIRKDDGLLNWGEAAEVLERKIRAYAVWPKSHTVLGDTEVIVTKASVRPDVMAPKKLEPGQVMTDKATGLLGVQTGNGWLVIEQLQPVGKKPMLAREFLAGYGNNF